MRIIQKILILSESIRPVISSIKTSRTWRLVGTDVKKWLSCFLVKVLTNAQTEETQKTA